MLIRTLLLSTFCLTMTMQAQQAPRVVEHLKVHHEQGRFDGWPANHGIWSWGNEILVGFSAGYFKDNGPDRHAIDHDRPEEHHHPLRL